MNLIFLFKFSLIYSSFDIFFFFLFIITDIQFCFSIFHLTQKCTFCIFSFFHACWFAVEEAMRCLLVLLQPVVQETLLSKTELSGSEMTRNCVTITRCLIEIHDRFHWRLGTEWSSRGWNFIVLWSSLRRPKKRNEIWSECFKKRWCEEKKLRALKMFKLERNHWRAFSCDCEGRKIFGIIVNGFLSLWALTMQWWPR